jgi:CheY-like chemotaxis protein
MPDRKQRLLIVDDEPDILWSLSLLLERVYDVTTAEGGESALRALETSEYDAMILDLMMPGMDGAALKQEMDTRGMKVPVVIVSAFSDVAERAARLGVRDHLTKPVEIPKLEAMLARVMDGAAHRGRATDDGSTPLADAAPGAPSPRRAPVKKDGDDHETRPMPAGDGDDETRLLGTASSSWRTIGQIPGRLSRLVSRHAVPSRAKESPSAVPATPPLPSPSAPSRRPRR